DGGWTPRPSEYRCTRPGPLGRYLARIVHSRTEHECETDLVLIVKFELYVNMYMSRNESIGFRIVDEDSEIERKGREILCRFATLFDIDMLSDSQQLHGKPFIITFWVPGGADGHFSLEAATDDQNALFEQMDDLRASLNRPRGGGGKAA